jgi:cysteinyl-tRNA synthetase
MGKSLGNFITLPEMFTGNHPKLEQAYTPMTVRFFILQAHYRGTLDFSNEALQAAEKGLASLMQAARDLYAMAGRKAPQYAYGEEAFGTAPDTCPATSEEVKAVFEGVYDTLCDDINTPGTVSQLFEAVRLINSAKAGSLKLSEGDIQTLVQVFDDVVFGVLGLRDDEALGAGANVIDGLMKMVLEERAKAKAAKDWATSDHIRDSLAALGIKVKDTKDGVEWSL